MKWLKRLLLAAMFLIVFAAVAGFVAWHMFRGVPDWYVRRKSTPQELEAAYARADKQIQRLVHDAEDAQHRQSIDATQPGHSSAQDEQPVQISLTDDELNIYFQKWDQALGWSHHYGSYLSNPQIVIQNGRLILAADVKEVGTVVSVAFEPRLADGKLQMPVTRVLAGRLPLPESFWRRDVNKLDESLHQHLPQWQDQARIARDGGANPAAIKAGMTELLMDLLNGRAADPVLFLPYNLTQMETGLPVRLTDEQISDHTLTLTVQPLSATQRRELLSRIQKSGTDTESDSAQASR